MAGFSVSHGGLLRKGVMQIGLSLSDEALHHIEQHLALVKKWQSKINLVSTRNDRALITHHALDSLVMMPLLAQSRNVLDVGTGAGFPGLPLACALPDSHFTLLDSRQRRIEFLRLVAVQLKLKNIDFVTARVEDYSQLNLRLPKTDPIEIDTIIARAVASLSQLVKLSQHLRQPGQRLVAMKGIFPQAELDELQQNFANEIRDIQVERLEVPFLDAERHAVMIQFD